MENKTLKYSILNKVILQGVATLMLFGASGIYANTISINQTSSSVQENQIESDTCDTDQWGNCVNYFVDPIWKSPKKIDWSKVYTPSSDKVGMLGTITCDSDKEVTLRVINGYFDACVPSGKIIKIMSADYDNFHKWVLKDGKAKIEEISKSETRILIKSSNGSTVTVEAISKTAPDVGGVQIISKYGAMGCLQYDFQVQLASCNKGASQKWLMDNLFDYTLIKKNNRCLTVVNEWSTRPNLQLEDCDNKPTQKWFIDTDFDGWSTAKIKLDGGIILTLDANYNVVMEHEVLGGSDSQLWKIIKG